MRASIGGGEGRIRIKTSAAIPLSIKELVAFIRQLGKGQNS